MPEHQPYDRTVKHLLATYGHDFLAHLCGLPVAPDAFEPLPTELAPITRAADALWWVRPAGEAPRLVHFEIQSRYDPAMPRRMLEYAARSHMHHKEAVHSWLLLLVPAPQSHEPIPQGVIWGGSAGGLAFGYHVVRVWELDPALGLAHPGLLPLYPLMDHPARTPAVLDACVARLDGWGFPPLERAKLIECVASLASLVYDRSIIRAWKERVRMIETPFMSWVREEGEAKGMAEGEAKGRAEGKAEGRAEGKVEGRAEGKAEALLEILEVRGLAVTSDQRHTILACRDLAQLDAWLKRGVTAPTVHDVLA